MGIYCRRRQYMLSGDNMCHKYRHRLLPTTLHNEVTIFVASHLLMHAFTIDINSWFYLNKPVLYHFQDSHFVPIEIIKRFIVYCNSNAPKIDIGEARNIRIWFFKISLMSWCRIKTSLTSTFEYLKGKKKKNWE